MEGQQRLVFSVTNFVDHVHAVDHFTEHTQVTPAACLTYRLRKFKQVVLEVVVRSRLMNDYCAVG